MLFFTVLLVLTWVYPAYPTFMSSPAGYWQYCGRYLGIFLMVGFFVAVGVFASSLFANQIAVFFARWGSCSSSAGSITLAGIRRGGRQRDAIPWDGPGIISTPFMPVSLN
jgi:hypothetical protein